MKKLNFILLTTLVAFLISSVVIGQQFSTAKKKDAGVTNVSVDRALYTLAYDGADVSNSIGLNPGPITWQNAVRFPASMLSAYAGATLEFVQVYVANYPVAGMKVGIFGQGPNGNTAGSAIIPFTSFSPISGSWNTIDLPSSPVISGSADMWIVIEIDQAAGTTYPAGCDAGPHNANGDWAAGVATTFPVFEHLSDYGLDYNWHIRGLIKTGPCPTQAESPSPADGATGVNVDYTALSYTLFDDVESIEIFCSTYELAVEYAAPWAMIYGGAPVQDFYIPFTLGYGTTYYWRVVTVCEQGKVYSDVWQFTTDDPPTAIALFEDDFELGAGNWTITNIDGADWEITSLAAWPNAVGPNMPPASTGNVMSCNSDFWVDYMESYLTLAVPVDLSSVVNPYLEFDYDYNAIAGWDYGSVEVSPDNGTTWYTVYSHVDGVDEPSAHFNLDLATVDGSFVGTTQFLVRFYYWGDWSWYWAIDNVEVGGFIADPAWIYGNIYYPDAIQTPLGNCDVNVYAPLDPWFHGFTWSDPAGYYDVVVNGDGAYYVSGWYDAYAPHIAGSVNSQDMFLLNRWAQKISNPPSVTHFLAGDLNVNGEIDFDDCDILADFVANGYTTAAWYWPKAFANVNNWVFDTYTTYVNGGFGYQDITGLAAGDVNASGYVFPRMVKFEKASMTISDVVVPISENIQVPVYVNQSVDLGAFILKFNYNNEMFKFDGITSALPIRTINKNDGSFSIYWAGESAKFDEGTELFVANFSKIGDKGDLNFSIDSEVSDMVNKDGNFVDLNLSTVQVGDVMPTVYELSQNFPNPFNPTTKISFSLPQADVVTLKVYDMLGSEVATLVNGKLEAGKYEYDFNANNLPSGAYVYRITTNNFTSVKKMMLLK
ncbi:MAG: T9SS type A sorting domain-containing protein [bacterium]